MATFSKMKPSELTRVLNSFSDVGTVMGPDQASRNLRKAGFRIAADADGKTINGFRYAAWLFDELQKKKSSNRRTYEEIKEAARKRSMAESVAGRDIGDIPAVANPERKQHCRESLMAFLETYFPQKFKLAWSEDHKVIISKIENAVLRGGLFALAMPRGSGKTTICERAALWAVAYGHRRFVAIIGATEEAARGNLDEIKTEIECNEIFSADFPEISFPIQQLEGITNRRGGQLCNGERTRISWASGEAVLPTIKGSVASGAVIKVRGLTGNMRGMKVGSASGESMRPDFVLVDDPQTDESAASPEQNRKRVKLLQGAILGLAGPANKIACVMPCTVIRHGDMADQILNREQNAVWNGERLKLLRSFPSNTELWDEYASLWRESLREDGNIQRATDFYEAHRAAMDEGAEVSWEERHEPDELSGIQYAMDLFIRDKETFFAEYQNEPQEAEESEVRQIQPEDILQRLNSRPHGTVPQDCVELTCYIDVQGKLLYWLIMAATTDFTCYVVDYGSFPDQHRRYYSLRDANPTFEDVYKNAGREGQIYSALRTLTDDLCSRKFKRDDGIEMRLSKVLIDSAWGESTRSVYRACIESEYSGVLLPAKGRGITAAQRPFTDYKREVGARIGFNWYLHKVRGAATRLFEIDTNFWKTFFRARLFTAPGDIGSLSVFGSNQEYHRLLSEHLSSERATITTGNGRRVDVWQLIPGRDNHWFDCACGCMAALSFCGIKLSISDSDTNVSEDIKTAETKQKQIQHAKTPAHITAGKHIAIKRK